jgi:hypothetical protein
LQNLLYVAIQITITERSNYHDQRGESDPAKDATPFWQYDEEIGEGCFFGEQATIRLKVHVSEEHYHRSEGDEIVPLRHNSGTRVYVMARPYILEPDYQISVSLYNRPTQEGAIGEVTSADLVGMHQRDVGQAQAWLYPQECTLVLWECFLEHWYRNEDPRTDENLKAIWLGFESFLLHNLSHDTSRIVTPSWEPLYDGDRRAWPEFLEELGYYRLGKRAYSKDV